MPEHRNSVFGFRVRWIVPKSPRKTFTVLIYFYILATGIQNIKLFSDRRNNDAIIMPLRAGAADRNSVERFRVWSYACEKKRFRFRSCFDLEYYFGLGGGGKKKKKNIFTTR